MNFSDTDCTTKMADALLFSPFDSLPDELVVKMAKYLGKNKNPFCHVYLKPLFQIRLSLNVDPDPGVSLKKDPDPGFLNNV